MKYLPYFFVFFLFAPNAFALTNVCAAGWGATADNATWTDTGTTNPSGFEIYRLGATNKYLCTGGSGGTNRWYLGAVFSPDGTCTFGSIVSADYFSGFPPLSDVTAMTGWTDNGGGNPTGTITSGSCASTAVPFFSILGLVRSFWLF